MTSEGLSNYSPSVDVNLDPNILREAYSELCVKDLFFLAKQILGYRDINEQTHGDICRLLETQVVKRKLICTPRGSLKSSLGVVAFSIFRTLQNPNIRILIDSELYTNSANFIREIRGHFESELLTGLFGQFKTKKDWTSGSLTIAQRTRNLKESTVIAGGVETGKVGQHYDLIICDDLNSQNNSQTEDGRKKVIDHYRHLNALLDPGGEIVVIGTRYAADDVYGFIIDNELSEEQRESLGIKKITKVDGLKGLL